MLDAGLFFVNTDDKTVGAPDRMGAAPFVRYAHNRNVKMT